MMNRKSRRYLTLPPIKFKIKRQPPLILWKRLRIIFWRQPTQTGPMNSKNSQKTSSWTFNWRSKSSTISSMAQIWMRRRRSYSLMISKSRERSSWVAYLLIARWGWPTTLSSIKMFQMLAKTTKKSLIFALSSHKVTSAFFAVPIFHLELCYLKWTYEKMPRRASRMLRKYSWVIWSLNWKRWVRLSVMI